MHRLWSNIWQWIYRINFQNFKNSHKFSKVFKHLAVDPLNKFSKVQQLIKVFKHLAVDLRNKFSKFQKILKLCKIGQWIHTSYHFSPQLQFLVQFFSTLKCVNRDKTDFVTKPIIQQNCIKCTYICWDILHIKHMTIFRFLHISYVMWRNSKYLQTTDVENFRCLQSQISPHDIFFSTYPIGDIGDKYEIWEVPRNTFEFSKNPQIVGIKSKKIIFYRYYHPLPTMFGQNFAYNVCKYAKNGSLYLIYVALFVICGRNNNFCVF